MSMEPVGSTTVSGAALSEPLSPVGSSKGSDSASCVGAPQNDRPRISPRAHFLSKLEMLAQSDTDKFKQLTSQIAGTLESAAAGAEGAEADRLKEMAERFRTASQTGTTDAIQPPKPPQAGGMRGYRPESQEESRVERSHTEPRPSGTSRAVWKEIFSMVEKA